ncbi:ABC transporter substrate-binding protein [Thalassococcus sp. S3]|uniref:ABC transporter substrate-binding protein n=1 Tax=Thalassococcus sp. S3 TaxID=2017482 RepID=UPI0010243AE9|nr:ABC transporter substrate-binding protein [Thalassococcus sp. S3]QBF30378.1 peptide ABC transporter substrate-binding protein [Thalassococcus sp. S3]
MKLMTRLMGAAAIAVSGLAAAPVFADGGTLVIASTQVPRHLNGAVQSGIATAVPSTQIFASPLRYDENWEPQPYLAQSWEVAEDGLSVTLNLVQNATFHDGEPVTSEDVAFSIMTTKENHPFKSMFAPVESIETPDPHTAIIRLSQPHPALLLALSPALAPVLPQHVYGDGQDVKTHPANTAPVGSGPFILEEFTAGEAVVMKKNPNFFIEGRPKLDEIIVRIIKDPSALLIAMENGDADMYPFMAGSQEIRRLEKVESLNVTTDGYAAVGPVNWIAFNTASPKLSDVRVRQAIAYAVDRDFITKALHRGVSSPQRGPIIESSPFFDETIPAYDVDLEKAQALMNEAGFGDGMELTVDYIPGPKEQQQSVAEYLKSQLKKIGIDVTVRAAPDFPTWAGRVSGHDFELTMDVVFNWGDPVIGVHRTYLSSNIVKGVIWSNTQQYTNERVDELLNAAAVELDVDKRKALYAEFQQLVAGDLPVYWVNALPYHTAYDARLQNVPTGIWGTMHPMDMVEWSE